MQTLVIGGSGFLGLHIVDALLDASHTVTVLSRNPTRARHQLPDAVAIIEGDLTALGSRALASLLSPFDKLVYAAGADERTRPDIDASDFFFAENVATCRKVLLAARDTGITHVAVLNSIFTCINRTLPELELTRHHPYIASRVAQSEMAIEVSRQHFVLTVLEVPWVFGDSRGNPSQWAALVNYVRFAPTLVAPTGGAVAISAENVGKATAGALHRPTQSSSIPIGDCTLSWDDMLRQLADLSGSRDTAIARLPRAAFAGMTRLGAWGLRLIGEQTGLDFSRLQDILLDDPRVDLAWSQSLLQYGRPDIKPALAATVACVPDYRPAAWRRAFREQIAPRIPLVTSPL